MALINCPECQKEISDKVKSCPYCGYPFEAESPVEPQKTEITKISKKSSRIQPIIISVGLLLVVAFLVYQGYKANKIAKEKAIQEAAIARQAEIKAQNLKIRQNNFERTIYNDLLQIKNRMNPVSYMIKNDEYKELVKPFIDEATAVYNLNSSQVSKIKSNNLYVGMPTSLLFLSWGITFKQNKTTSQSGEKIQYIYETSFLPGGKNKYAYAENGFVTSWQE